MFRSIHTKVLSESLWPPAVSGNHTDVASNQMYSQDTDLFLKIKILTLAAFCQQRRLHIIEVSHCTLQASYS